MVFETGGRAAWMKRVFTKLGMRCVVTDARMLAQLGVADELMGAGGPDAERPLHDTWVRAIVKGTGSTLRGGTADAFHQRREEVGAYLGLFVRRDQSGKLDPALGISKCGNGFMRRLLVQCAAHILGPFGKDCA